MEELDVEMEYCEEEKTWWDTYQDAYEFLTFENLKSIANNKGIIYPDENTNDSKSIEQWSKWRNILKDLLKEKNERKQHKLFVRGIGNKQDIALLQELYNEMFDGAIQLAVDKNKNSNPKGVIAAVTGYVKVDSTKRNAKNKKRYKVVYNYQVSHIWGHTNNPLLFIAPWNICYLSKILDPFSGHEATGILPKQFSAWLKELFFNRYKKDIEVYNDFLSKYQNNGKSIAEMVQSFFERKEQEMINGNIKKGIIESWLPIKA